MKKSASSATPAQHETRRAAISVLALKIAGAERRAVVEHGIDGLAGGESAYLGVHDDFAGEDPGTAGAGAFALAGLTFKVG